ncbi:MAG: amidohydrolase [Zoogloeaceae bacterium]|jgi:aminobenzoyl-glutamate utilization protein B|nr:amidohydrolase [Zoogloeaceae bacterium]
MIYSLCALFFSLRFIALIALAVCIFPLPVHAEEVSPERLERLKQDLLANIETHRKTGQVVNDMLFSFSELAYEEKETARFLTGLLEQNGFSIRRGVGGLPTAWIATWGSGKPVIALGSDVDGVPKTSQKPGVAWREALVEGAPGHGEGHNSGQAVNVVAALALKEIMTREHLPGTLVLWPGVAEELLGGKAFLVRAGVFKDVDFVLFNHVGNNLGTRWGQGYGTGLVSLEYTFTGESAHAAAAWHGRSALDAVEIMNTAWNFRREHLRPEQRSHYVITDGGDQPNVVPSRASVWYYIREMDFENIRKNVKIADDIAAGAALATGTQVTRRVVGSAAPRHFNRPLAEAAQVNIERVGLPTWTEEEQRFAKAVQALVEQPQTGLNTSLAELRAPVPASGPSDDIGDVTWAVPTITVSYPANIPNLPVHHWSSAIAMATPIAHKGVLFGAKAVGLTALDLLLRPELGDAARAYFTNVQTKAGSYVQFLGPEDTPVLDRNRQVTEQYRPLLERLYYDPQRYDTYLDQLGVRFPQFAKP